MKAGQVMAAYSPGYFRLIGEKPGPAKFFSVGVRIIIVYQGSNYKIIE